MYRKLLIGGSSAASSKCLGAEVVAKPTLLSIEHILILNNLAKRLSEVLIPLFFENESMGLKGPPLYPFSPCSLPVILLDHTHFLSPDAILGQGTD